MSEIELKDAYAKWADELVGYATVLVGADAADDVVADTFASLIVRERDDSARSVPSRWHGQPDDSASRRLVTEMVDEAPSASDWSQIEQRARRPDRAPSIERQHSNTPRIALMLVASAATLVIGVTAFVSTRASSPVDRIGPSVLGTADTVPEATTSTEAPQFEPVATAEADVGETLPDPNESDPREEAGSQFDDVFIGDVTVDDVIVPVDYEEAVLATATALPDDAWVVAGTLPGGIVARYATGDVGRRVEYGDAEGRSILVGTDLQPFGGGEELDVDGVVWNFEESDDSTRYTREVGSTTVYVTTVGVDRDAANAVLRDLRVGGDSVLPVEVIQPIGIVRRDSDLVATDVGAFRSPATFRARGVNGWYCTETASWSGSTSGCGVGRNGRLSTDVIVQSNGVPDVDGVSRSVLAGIVSPEVTEVEIDFADGTATRTAAADASGLHDDNFWIIEIVLTDDDPFLDRLAGVEVRLLAADGAVLGTASLSE